MNKYTDSKLADNLFQCRERSLHGFKPPNTLASGLQMVHPPKRNTPIAITGLPTHGILDTEYQSPNKFTNSQVSVCIVAAELNLLLKC